MVYRQNSQTMNCIFTAYFYVIQRKRWFYKAIYFTVIRIEENN